MSETATSSHLIFYKTPVEHYWIDIPIPSFLLEAPSIGNQTCPRESKSFPQPKGGGYEVTNDMDANDKNQHLPHIRDVVHVDEVKHAHSVPELRAIAEVRFCENATVTSAPIIWRRKELHVQACLLHVVTMDSQSRPPRTTSSAVPPQKSDLKEGLAARLTRNPQTIVREGEPCLTTGTVLVGLCWVYANLGLEGEW